jgi:integrase
MSKQLTAAAVEKLRPDAHRIEHRDGGCPGLYLIIQTSGHKSWALRFRKPNGKPAKLTLGPVDLSGNEPANDPVIGQPLTLASARRIATDLNRQRAMGQDVVAARAREKLERKTRGAKTFGQAALDFVEQHSMRNTRRWEERARLLGVRPAEGGQGLELIPKSLAQRWSDRPISEIDGDDIHAIIDEVREKGTPGLSIRVKGPTESRALVMYATLSKMFAWLVQRRRVKQNPVMGVHRPATHEARDRVLLNSEIVLFWSAVEKERKEFSALFKTLLLTGQRLNEVAGMRRTELSDDGVTWTIPGARTKNRRVHVVPLPLLAQKLIKSTGPRGDIIFTTNGRSPISGWSKLKRRIDKAMVAAAEAEAGKKEKRAIKVELSHWRLHDLRRTCATGMAEIGVAPHVIEAVLNHVSGHKAGVAGIYNRAAYAVEKKAALERWATHVEALISGAKSTVVPFARGGQ